MKKTLKIMGLLLITAAFVTCDALEEADDVTFHADLEIIFVADENGEGVGVPYDDLQTLDFADNSEIAPYLDKIKDIEITRVTYRITGYQEDPNADPPCTNVVMTNGFAKFGKVGTLEEITLGSFAATAAGVNLQSTVSETDLTIDPAQFKALADLLLDDKKANIYSVGTLSCTPIQFNVVSKFYVTITANALN
jgi:hypothetical protein